MQQYVLGFLIFALIFSFIAILYYKRALSSQKKVFPADKEPSIQSEGIKGALAKTRQGLIKKFEALILSTKKIDESLLGPLEELLYTSDLGPATVEKLLMNVREKLSHGQLAELSSVKRTLRTSMEEIFDKNRRSSKTGRPQVILIVGVNGVGKTTSIGKLAYYHTQKGKRVMVVAADTFRAAAQEQLEVWAERAQAGYYSTDQTEDPAAVAYQGLQKALSEKAEVVIIDTAGRLHNKENLMAELMKVKKVVEKLLPGAPHEVLLVVDANSGQNAIQQAKLFNQNLGLTGLIVTKLDGTAKGGVVVAIAEEVGLNPEFIGVGEKVSDFETFSSTEYTSGLLGD